MLETDICLKIDLLVFLTSKICFLKYSTGRRLLYIITTRLMAATFRCLDTGTKKKEKRLPASLRVVASNVKIIIKEEMDLCPAMYSKKQILLVSQ